MCLGGSSSPAPAKPPEAPPAPEATPEELITPEETATKSKERKQTKTKASGLDNYRNDAGLNVDKTGNGLNVPV